MDPERGIVRITSCDERWYSREATDGSTGIPMLEFRPSVTWISSFYPKGKGFEHWLKKNGDDADMIVALAAERGYKIHRAIAVLNEGGTVKMTDEFENDDGRLEPLTPDEYAGVMSYVDWWRSEAQGRLQILGSEFTIWPDADACALKFGMPADLFRFAGTVDLKVRSILHDTIGIIDFKTSLDIWPSHEIQISAYAKALGADWRAILQLNYRRNKLKKWKLTEVPDRFNLFSATHAIWKHETDGVEPLQRDFPLELKLDGGPVVEQVPPPKKRGKAKE